MVRTRRLLGMLALLGFGLVLSATALAETAVYKGRHRLAEDLLPLAEAAVGGEGHVVVDPNTNSLVILGSPKVIAEALALLERQDQALKSVLIQYQQQRESELDASGVEVRWSTRGPLRIGNVVDPGGEGGIDVRARASSGTRSGDRSGSLRVLDGQTGRIQTGSQIPYETGGLRNRTTTFVDASSGFEVRPRVLGDGRVRLELQPFGAQVRPDGSISTGGAATTLVVQPGETVVVGGIGGSVDRQMQSALSGSSRSQRSDREVLLVTVQTD